MATVSNTNACECPELDAIGPECMVQHMSDNDSSATTRNFDCNICLEESRDPVVTMCGHLFCWSCLHRWITIHSVLEECPVCKACVKDNIIPLYGRGKTGFTKPESKMMHGFYTPRRPSAHLNLATASRIPRNTDFQYIRQQSHGRIAQENYGPQGAYSASSVAVFGLLPALFGIYTVTTSSNDGGYPFATSYNSMSFRMPTISSMSSQQRQSNAQQEFVLYWFLILLAGFVILCFLLF